MVLNGAIRHLCDAADALQLVVGQNWLRHLKPLEVRCAFQVQDVRPRTDKGDKAHDQLLADRVDGRVRHLGEVLLEIGVEQLRLG